MGEFILARRDVLKFKDDQPDLVSDLFLMPHAAFMHHKKVHADYSKRLKLSSNQGAPIYDWELVCDDADSLVLTDEYSDIAMKEFDPNLSLGVDGDVNTKMPILMIDTGVKTLPRIDWTSSLLDSVSGRLRDYADLLRRKRELVEAKQERIEAKLYQLRFDYEDDSKSFLYACSTDSELSLGELNAVYHNGVMLPFEVYDGTSGSSKVLYRNYIEGSPNSRDVSELEFELITNSISLMRSLVWGKRIVRGLSLAFAEIKPYAMVDPDGRSPAVMSYCPEEAASQDLRKFVKFPF